MTHAKNRTVKTDGPISDALLAADADFASCRTERVRADGTVLQIDEPPVPAPMVAGPRYARMLVRGQAKAYACTKLFRRELLGSAPWDEGRAYEDIAPAVRMSLAAERVALVDEPLYRYLYREGSISTALTERTLDLFDAGADVRAAVRTRGLAGLWSAELRAFHYREVLTSVAHMAMRAEHASGRTELTRRAIRRVRRGVRLRDAPLLAGTGYRREAVFAVLMAASPGLYSTILRRR